MWLHGLRSRAGSLCQSQQWCLGCDVLRRARWPERYLAVFQAAPLRNILATFKFGVHFSTEYSGCGAPEIAIQKILRTVETTHPDPDGRRGILHGPAGDVLERCRRALLHIPGSGCIRGDMLVRAPETVLAQIRSLMEVARSRLAHCKAQRNGVQHIGKELLFKAGAT